MRTTFIVLACVAVAGAQATQFFNSTSFANNGTVLNDWKTAAGITDPQFFEDFESYTVGTDMDGATIIGGAVTDNTGTGTMTIESAPAQFGGSNPIDTKALRHNESQYLEFLFATPTSYFGGYGIDHGTTTVIVHYTDTSTENFTLNNTTSGGDSAQFFGLVAEGGLNITRIQLDATGDAEWGVDNVMYNAVPEPASMIALGAGLAALLRRRKK